MAKRTLFIIMALALALAGPLLVRDATAAGQGKPHLYGQVIIDNGSTAAGMEQVVFDHWRHRTRITCKICHLDLGIAMRANATGISATYIQGRRYCGTCHNGQASLNGRAIFAACSPASGETFAENCRRCHNDGQRPEVKEAFLRLAARLPKERFGNRIDWEKAEALGLIQPANFIEGVSKANGNRPIAEDFALQAKEVGMSNILFSHRKHTAWNGCEVCHPDIFLGGEKGSTQYSMQDLFAGKYWGSVTTRSLSRRRIV